MSTIADYPVQAGGGPLINRIIDYPIEYQFTRYEYDDGGCDINVQPCGLKRWGLEYEGLTPAELTTIIDHFNLAKQSVNDFTFINAQDGNTFAGVKYEQINIPRHVKKWALALNVTLWKLI